MCALFGWLDYKGIVSNKLLKKLTQALANAAEERGTDASGIAYVKNGKMTIFKRPKPAHKLRFNTPSGTKAVMGHTRMTIIPFMDMLIRTLLLLIMVCYTTTSNCVRKSICQKQK